MAIHPVRYQRADLEPSDNSLHAADKLLPPQTKDAVDMELRHEDGSERNSLCVIVVDVRSCASAAVHEFQLRDTEGSVHIPAEWRAHKLIVLFFVTNDCPLTNSYVPEMNRIQSSYAKRRVCFYAVQADPNSLSAVMAAY